MATELIIAEEKTACYQPLVCAMGSNGLYEDEIAHGKAEKGVAFVLKTRGLYDKVIGHM